MSAILQSMQTAIAHHQAGRLKQAEVLYREVLSRAPRQPDALHLIGLLAHQQGRHDEAIVQIEEAISHNDRVGSYYNNLGAALRSSGKLAQAAAAFANALQIERSNDGAWSNLTGLLYELGHARDLAEALESWVAHCPHSTRALQQRAAHHTGHGAIDQAIADHQRCAQLSPTDPEPLLKVAILAHQQGDDATALQNFTAARARFFTRAQLGESTVQSKLDHDIEQITWLLKTGRVSPDFSEVLDAFTQARHALYSRQETSLQAKHIDAQTRERIGRWYNLPIHLEPCTARAQGALSTHFDGMAAQDRYRQTQPGITWADDLLSPGALEDLRRFCMGSTIWTDFRYTGGYVGTALANGFANGLLLQIARELRARMPDLIGPHPLRQMWAYKYDQRLTGIGPHADSAAINVNFWITPDSANKNPETGGLVVWRRCAPLDWDFDAFNRQPEVLMDWLQSTGAQEIHVPYRCNRAVIFDSNLVHRTGDLDFESGYENRRVNITMLFGQRGKLD